MKTGYSTPWGPALTVEVIAPGLHQVATEGHGGILVDDERMACMPASIAALRTWSGVRGAYEEDSDWALVVLSFPEEFDERRCASAIATTRSSRGDTFDIDAYLAGTPQGRLLEAKARQMIDDPRLWADTATNGQEWLCRWRHRPFVDVAHTTVREQVRLWIAVWESDADISTAIY